MPNLYVIRHGQTDCNAQQLIQGPRIDSHLSSLGEAQADALADAFEATPLDAVYVSPMERARETAAALLASRTGLAVGQVVPELYEMDFGAFCGRHLPDVEAEMEQIYDAWGMGFIDQAFPGGESPVLAQHRIRRFADAVRAQATRQDVAVVAHGRINRILLATWLGVSLAGLSRFPQDNANITHLEVLPDGVMLRRLNDTAHLT